MESSFGDDSRSTLSIIDNDELLNISHDTPFLMVKCVFFFLRVKSKFRWLSPNFKRLNHDFDLEILDAALVFSVLPGTQEDQTLVAKAWKAGIYGWITEIRLYESIDQPRIVD